MTDLIRNSDSKSKPKFKIDCGAKITPENPTTTHWLSNLTYLKTIDKIKAKMTRKSILEGIFLKEHSVVVKISNNQENLKKEYDIYEELAKHNIKGILHYYCYFECNDSIKRIDDGINESLCNGTGDTMRILVMEYIKNKSFGMHQWKDIEQIKSCIKQVICTCLDAFLKCGFVHGDLNCNNILIKNTSITQIIYKFNDKEISIPVKGYKTLFMDFEWSEINKTAEEFFKDLKLNFATSLSRYIGSNNNVNFIILQQFGIEFDKLQNKAKNTEDALWVLDILPLVDQL